MKKTLALILSILILICSLTAVSSAQENETPLIVVTGYGTPALFENYGEENQSRAWIFSPTDAIMYALNDLKNVLPATAEFLQGKGEQLGHCVAKAGSTILPYMYCNPDGSSVGNVSHIPNNPETTSYADLKNTLEAYEPWLCEAVAGEYVSEENIFIFQYDFRMSALDISDELNDYVNAVLEFTGKDKADIFGLSFGGLLVGTYLSRFGTEGKIEDAVLSVPALGGTTFASAFIQGKCELPVSQLLQYLNSAINLELDIYQLTDILEKNGVDGKFLDQTVVSFTQDMNGMPLYWNSLWDLLPRDDYEILKTQLLDSEESAEIIRKSDYIHHEIMPNYNKNFTACMEKGVNISIFTSTGKQNAFGSVNNADMLVDAKFGSGAVCTDLGKRFSDGYTGVYTVCSNRTHNHVSPAMNIDASSAYLPENTWFVEGQGHGTYFAEECSMGLIKKLLFSGEKIDVHTYPEYPQFATSALPVYGVYAKFDSSVNGRLCGDDKALVITNVSVLHPIKLTSAVTDIPGIKFDLSGVSTLLPGESVTVPFTGEIPAESAVHHTVTLEFVRVGSITPCNVRCFDFTVENGTAPEYSGGFTDTEEVHVRLSFVETVKRTVEALINAVKDITGRIINMISSK